MFAVVTVAVVHNNGRNFSGTIPEFRQGNQSLAANCPAMGGARLLLALALVLTPTFAYVSNAYDGTAGKGNVAGTYLARDLRFSCL